MIDEHTKHRLDALLYQFNSELDRVHDETLAKFRSLAKSVGQRTRVDRVFPPVSRYQKVKS